MDEFNGDPRGTFAGAQWPRPRWEKEPEQAGYAPPRSPLEKVVAAIWVEVLRVEAVVGSDNFYELGGSALEVMQLLDKLESHGLWAEARDIFDNPTLEQFCAVLTRGPVPADLVSRTLIQPVCAHITPDMLPLVQLSEDEIHRIVDTVPGGAANVRDIYPLAPLQEGILFHCLLEPGRSAYLVSHFLECESRAQMDAFIHAAQKVKNRHNALRTAVLWKGLPRPVQVVYRRAARGGGGRGRGGGGGPRGRRR